MEKEVPFSIEPIHGKVFKHMGKKFEVVYGKECADICSFREIDGCNAIRCSSSYRNDKKDIYLIEIRS